MAEPLFGTPIVYVFIDPNSTPEIEIPAQEFAATSLGNIKDASVSVTGATEIDINVEGMGQPIQSLFGVPKFQAGQQHSGWRFYTPQEAASREWGVPTEQE